MKQPNSLSGRRQFGRSLMMILGAIVLVGIVGLLVLETVRRQRLYWYDVEVDYHYDFGSESPGSAPVQLSGNGFSFPLTDGSWDTALLKIRIRSTLSGYWFEPCIRIDVEHAGAKQCFERGAAGDRYLLLQRTWAQPGALVRLRGEHLEWRKQSSSLQFFDNSDLRKGPLLVLAPHPDDAEIAAFGLYSARDSFVVTMTAGNYVDGLYSDLDIAEPAQDQVRGEVRTWDSLVVPLWGGVSVNNVVNLGYETHSLQRFHEAPEADPDTVIGPYRQGAVDTLLAGRVATPDWESVIADLKTVLTTANPAIVVAPHPSLDAHPDHQFTTVALLEALSDLRDLTTILLLYTNHYTSSESYPYGPSEASITLPPWTDPGLKFSAIYSHPLDPDAQLKKLFALEAMHDLRAPPKRLNGGPITVLIDRMEQAAQLIRKDPFGDYSYYRRAVRPNELFFVYLPADRPALRTFVVQQLSADQR